MLVACVSTLFVRPIPAPNFNVGAQLTGRVVGDAKAGQGGEEGTEAGGVAVAVVGGVGICIAKVPVRRHTVAEGRSAWR